MKIWKYKLTHYSILLVAIIVLFGLPNTTNASVVSMSTPSNSILNNGLVGWWTFDGKDIVNGVILDKSGNGNHGTPSGIASSTFYSQGKIGQGGNFDGSDDYVNTNNLWTSLVTSGTMSFSVWAKRTVLGDEVSSAGPNVIHVSKTDARAHLAIRAKSTWYAEARGASGPVYLDSGVTIELNKWTHIVVTIYNSTDVVIYIDGVFKGTIDTATVSTISGTAKYGTIGAWNNAGTRSRFFLGGIDDVRIYSRVLSAAEVGQLYNQATTKYNVSNILPSTNPLQTGLVGHWTFDGGDISNGVILDKSGSGNHGTPSGIASSTFYSQGKIGQGGNFDGVDDLVNAGSGTSLDNLGPLTVSVWVKTDSAGEGTQGYFVQKAGATGANGWRFNILSNYLRFNVVYNSTNLSANSTAGTFSSSDYNKWVHLVAVWDGTSESDNVYFYKNGVNISGGTNTDGSTDRVTDGNQNLIIGNDSVGGRSFDGTMDEVRIYSRALSVTEVGQLYNQATTKYNVSNILPPTNPLQTGLVGHWTFDGRDMANGVARDVSGNGNNGNLVNISTSTFYTQGKIGQGGNFDGADDYVQTASISAAGLTGLSYSFWVRQTGTLANNSSMISWGSGTKRCKVITSNAVQCTVQDSNVDVFPSSTKINDGKWHHIVFTSTASAQVVYVDGVAEGSGTQTLSTASGVLRIGANSYSTPASFYNGTIDDVRVYNRVLSVTEVKQLYNIGR